MPKRAFSAIGQGCLLLVWLSLVISCVRDDDWDMRPPGQDTAPHPEIQSLSRQEIQRFVSDNRLLNPANGMSYNAVSPIRYIDMSNRNAAAGVIRVVQDDKIEQWVFYKKDGELIANRVRAIRRRGSAAAGGFSGVILVRALKGRAGTAYVYKRGRIKRIYVGDWAGSSMEDEVTEEWIGTRNGLPDEHGKPKWHKGIDLKNPYGAPDYAMYDGMATLHTQYNNKGKVAGAGYYVTVASQIDGKRVEIVYFHMQKERRVSGAVKQPCP